MNIDRELLDLAAKAAGLEVFGWDARGNACVDPVDYRPWNPLTDDGDALRLAVKLELDINHIIGEVQVNRSHPHPKVDVFEDHGADPYAATRRTIVRAAAEIGKAMK